MNLSKFLQNISRISQQTIQYSEFLKNYSELSYRPPKLIKNFLAISFKIFQENTYEIPSRLKNL